jgi:hypothetical protein
MTFNLPPETTMETTHAGLLIENGKMTPVQVGDYMDMYSLMHCQTFTTCFRVYLSQNRSLFGFCDDEFLINGNPNGWNVCIGFTLRTDAPYPIGGNVLILASDGEGETVDMTSAEMNRFTVDEERYVAVLGGVARVLPVLNYNG